MDTKQFILDRYGLDENSKMPLDIPHSRWKEMTPLFKDLGFKIGVEIGVFKGQFLKNLCKGGFKMYGIDPWEDYDTYNDYKGEDFIEYEKEARERLKDYDCTIVKKWSMDAVDDFEDESLDFVFIDGNHALEYVIEDIAAWSKKVRKGGIISGHDFFRAKHTSNLMHVKDAVDTWVYCYKIKPLFLFRGDKCPSWFYVKE